MHGVIETRSAGVIDQNVDAPKARHRFVNDLLELVGIAHIDIRSEGLPSRRVDPLNGLLNIRRGILRDDDNVGPVGSKTEGDGLSNSSCGSCDEDGLFDIFTVKNLRLSVLCGADIYNDFFREEKPPRF